MSEFWRKLGKGEIIRAGDEVDDGHPMKGDSKWIPATCIGERAPDPKFPAHRVYRRRCSEHDEVAGGAAEPEENGCGGPQEACMKPGCRECGTPRWFPARRVYRRRFAENDVDRGAVGGPAGPAVEVVYIAGRISGMDRGNREAFAAAAAGIRSQGRAPLNPQGLLDGTELPYERCMDICLAMVRACGTVHCLEGWRKSPGASAEVALARCLGKRIEGALQ